MERYLEKPFQLVLVEAKFQGGSEWYQGKIISINTDNIENYIVFNIKMEILRKM